MCFNNKALLVGKSNISNCNDRNNLALNSLHLHHSAKKKYISCLISRLIKDKNQYKNYRLT